MVETYTSASGCDPTQYSHPMSALVVEGGAIRSVFSSGLLDGFFEHSFNPFGVYIGVSAGTSN